MPEPSNLLVLNAADNVGVLTARVETGETRLSAGHKIARSPIPRGAEIVKFGQVIGYATADIPAGAHVHVHNCAFGAHDQRERSMQVGFEQAQRRVAGRANDEHAVCVL